MSDTSYIRPSDGSPAAADTSHGAEWDAPQVRATQCDGCKRDPEELAGTDQAEQAPGLARGTTRKRSATLVAEPLERGFGVTLGNALRRVLLSSLQGAAVQSVHIDGVLHEFSSIAGVREDVTDIVLNIKDIAIKMQGEGPKRMVVKKSGPGTVTAGDIQTVGDVVVLNPDLVLCTLDEGAEIRMEFTVNTGKGYVPSERNRPEDAPIGLIPVDSLYSPVRKVSYKVENTREGQILDYDKLTLQIETNGAVTPEDALAYAARILQDQLNVFVNFEEPTQGAGRGHRSRISPSTRRSSRRSTSSSCRCARPTVSRTTTSSTSAIWCRRPKPRCSAPRTSAASRSTRSRKCWRRWACTSAWKCRAGRPRTSKSSRSASRITTELDVQRRGRLRRPRLFWANAGSPPERSVRRTVATQRR